ncbi:hypothetical protein EBZ39_12770, partial [bacterium]|nr:hypothetical protein [bacterium]
PHGVPETTPGHHGICTGTLPKYHGATYNSWFSPDYQKVRYEVDERPQAAVLHANNAAAQPGISPHNTKVDGLSDQFMQVATREQGYAAYAFSLKMHPVVSCANRLGKAFWFDCQAGGFTSSKAYFNQLPKWVTRFNKRYARLINNPMHWSLSQPAKSAAYQFPNITDYRFAGPPGKLANTTPSREVWREHFTKTPAASQLLLNLAKNTMDELLEQGKDHFLFWISLSTLDLCGHVFGPDSLECIDTLYHLDQQIGNFMTQVNQTIGAKDTLYVLTGDHGVCPIPEIVAERGNNLAKRILAKPMLAEMNKLVEAKYGLKNFVRAYEPCMFMVDQEIKKQLPPAQLFNVLHDLKTLLLKEPGIKKVWTWDELHRLPFEADQLEQFCKNQLYKDRNADIIVMTEPFCLLTHYPAGTAHSSPYEYDTHVPLVVYRKGCIQKMTVADKVWIPQLPVTLAQLLGVGQPSASTYKALPGIV